MRERWVIGNWKQNLLRGEARQLSRSVSMGLQHSGADQRVRVGLSPSYVAMDVVHASIEDNGAMGLFAQDVAAQESGAFTGEIGPKMLLDVGCLGTLVGHSERRSHFGDDDKRVRAKLLAAASAGLKVVLCVGERLEQRDAGEHEATVRAQLDAALGNLEPAQDAAVREHLLAVAYEPVWAIGTGRTATPEQAGAMHRTVRAWLTERFGADGADRCILYGGSVKPGNAADLLQADDVDGFLVGGASLDAGSFLDIVRLSAG